jgi:hypothetical protein
VGFLEGGGGIPGGIVIECVCYSIGGEIDAAGMGDVTVLILIVFLRVGMRRRSECAVFSQTQVW